MFVCPKCHRERVAEKCQYAHTSRQVVRCKLCGQTAKCVDCHNVPTEVALPQSPPPPITITAENHPENR